ncbi:MAG: neutral zinc metallopeptidase, partial [Acidimicrobiales bacterium]
MVNSWASRIRRAFVPAVAALVVLASGVTLGACGSSPAPGSSSGSSGPKRPIDGPKIDKLPTAPGPSASPGAPDLSTEAGQTTFLHQVFSDIQTMWSEEFTKSGQGYSPARLVLFRSKVATACGTESANVGPFYCSGDQTVYLDIRFFLTLEAKFGVSGDFAEAYVVAHEFGHHVQNLVGVTGRVAAAEQADPSQSNALSVRAELQADCLAGVWAHSAYERSLLEPGDIKEALHAAQVVGDDFLAHASGASAVDPD